jgi:hypothetical protein
MAALQIGNMLGKGSYGTTFEAHLRADATAAVRSLLYSCCYRFIITDMVLLHIFLDIAVSQRHGEETSFERRI